MVPVGSSVMLERVLAVHSYHVIAYLDKVLISVSKKHCSYSFQNDVMSTYFVAFYVQLRLIVVKFHHDLYFRSVKFEFVPKSGHF